jgi:regulator of cell morphogenesis and NO signaling
MNTQSTVGQLVVERPSRARVFEQFGIDYCCGGKKPLEQACADKKVDLKQLLSAIEAADSTAQPAERDWAAATLAELADNIEQTHHAYMKKELPRLEYLTGRVLNAHGAGHPELAELREVFMALKDEMESHMMKEERILFPLCRELEQSAGPVHSHCGSVGNPIAVMVAEHEQAGSALAQMRHLTHDYTPPEGACNTYRAMLSALAEVEADMHRHVHKENNILFPRALDLETRRNGSR